MVSLGAPPVAWGESREANYFFSFPVFLCLLSVSLSALFSTKLAFLIKSFLFVCNALRSGSDFANVTFLGFSFSIPPQVLFVSPKHLIKSTTFFESAILGSLGRAPLSKSK